MLTSLIMLAAYVLLALPAALIGLPWTFLTKDIGMLYRWSMWIVRTGTRLGGIRVEVAGQENIPAGHACIFMSNHVSNLDPPVLLPLFPFRTAYFLKRSLINIPILGLGMRLAGFIPVDRDGKVESARASMRTGLKVLESGVSVSTFPEGTRSPTGRLLSFKKGPFYLAMEAGAPIIPVSIWGTERMMTKGSLRITPGTAHVTFHPPIYPAQFSLREQLMSAVRAAVASGLPVWMTETAVEMPTIKTLQQ